MNYSSIALGILGAALVNNSIGFLWYGLCFAKPWQRLSKLTPNPDGMIKGMVGTMVTSAVMAAVMVCFMTRLGITTPCGAFHFAWMSWLGFVATVTFQGVLYSGMPCGLYLLNNGYNLISMIAMAQLLVVALRHA